MPANALSADECAALAAKCHAKAVAFREYAEYGGKPPSGDGAIVAQALDVYAAVLEPSTALIDAMARAAFSAWPERDAEWEHYDETTHAQYRADVSATLPALLALTGTATTTEGTKTDG